MKVHVRPLFACDAPRLRLEPGPDGGVEVDVPPDATFASVYATLFDGPVRVVDRHGVCPPLHWPFGILALLDGAKVPAYFFVDVLRMRAVPDGDSMTVVVRDMHLFHTPAYTSAMRWLVKETYRPLVLPTQIVTRAGPDCVRDDKHEWTVREWLATFPRAYEDALDVKVTHRDDRCVLAHAGDVVFCLPHDAPAVPTPVKTKRQRKA